MGAMPDGKPERRLVIDVTRLRDAMAVDSSFLIPAVDVDSREDGARERQELLRAMVDREATTIVVPYPVLAERLLSGRDGYRNIASIEFAVFEMKAADILTRKIGIHAALKGAKPTLHRQRLKYDAMIVATAKAWGASCILSKDGDIRRFAEMVELDCLDWTDFFVAAEPHQVAFEL